MIHFRGVLLCRRAILISIVLNSIPSLLNKINEMEEEFEKPAKGRPMKGGKSGNDSKGLTRGRIKKVNEFMTDLKGVMVSIDNQHYLHGISRSILEYAMLLFLL